MMAAGWPLAAAVPVALPAAMYWGTAGACTHAGRPGRHGHMEAWHCSMQDVTSPHQTLACPLLAPHLSGPACASRSSMMARTRAASQACCITTDDQCASSCQPAGEAGAGAGASGATATQCRCTVATILDHPWYMQLRLVQAACQVQQQDWCRCHRLICVGADAAKRELLHAVAALLALLLPHCTASPAGQAPPASVLW